MALTRIVNENDFERTYIYDFDPDYLHTISKLEIMEKYSVYLNKYFYSDIFKTIMSYLSFETIKIKITAVKTKTKNKNKNKCKYKCALNEKNLTIETDCMLYRCFYINSEILCNYCHQIYQNENEYIKINKNLLKQSIYVRDNIDCNKITAIIYDLECDKCGICGSDEYKLNFFSKNATDVLFGKKDIQNDILMVSSDHQSNIEKIKEFHYHITKGCRINLEEFIKIVTDNINLGYIVIFTEPFMVNRDRFDYTIHLVTICPYDYYISIVNQLKIQQNIIKQIF